MRREDFTYVRTKRSRTVHAVNPLHPRTLLCGWGNDYRREPCEYDAEHLCFECAAKLREFCQTYETPVLRRLNGKPRKLSRSAWENIKLEAAQKGYWGILR